jgi:hypothetical protein
LDEIRLAVQKGYRLVKVYEVYEYQVTRYDPKTRESVLFAQYIDTFLKLKAEASGFPDWVHNADDEDRYVRDFNTSEGVALDKDGIRPNPAKRGLAKLCLNSMWCKLTERNNRTKTKLITDPLELYRFLSMPEIEVANLVFANDTMVWASWRFIAVEKVPSLGHTNEVIGAYVTAGARIHLYDYVDRLQERAMYCDRFSLVRPA